MGATQVSCKCLKNFKENVNEVDLAKSDYLKSRSSNLKISNDKRNDSPLKTSNRIMINLTEEKTENENNLKGGNNNEINTNTYQTKVKDTLQNKVIEEQKENKSIDTNNNKSINTFSINNEANDIIKVKTCSTINFIKDVDKSIFITENIKKAEKNFKRPINYEKDWAQYCDDNDNEDMLVLVNSMNKNKGVDHTEEDGQIIDYHGKKFLYNGELDKNQKPVGFGVLYMEGKKYEGNFIKGKLIGLGRFINEEGTCFEGIFENGNLVSKAKIIKNIDNQKVTYFGEVVDFKKNGKGEETCEDYKYTGEFLGDLRHGKGRLEFLKDGNVYEGDFIRGEMTGKGKYVWSNKQIYEGDFVNGIKHGKGIYIWPDGFEYNGEYVNGIREGRGIYKWKDGRVFEGMFKNGKPDGKGKLTYKGVTILCEYKNGKQLTDIKKSLHQQMTGDI